MSSEMMTALVTQAVVLGVAGAVALGLASRLRVVCGPNEVLVLAGRVHRSADGTTVTYRVVTDGVAFRFPLLEQLYRFPIGPFSRDSSVEGIYDRHGRALRVKLIGQVEVDRSPSRLPNAIERFLGRDSEEMTRAAFQTVEGALREAATEREASALLEGDDELASATETVAAEGLGKLGLRLVSLVVMTSLDDEAGSTPRQPEP